MKNQNSEPLRVAQAIRGRVYLMIGLTLILASLCFWLPRGQPYFFSFEHKHADMRTALLSPRLDTIYDRLVFVAITEAELEQMTYRSPIDRAWLANLVTTLDEQDPAVIAIDIQLDQPTEPAKDEKLIQAIRNANTPIVLPAIDSRLKLTERQKSYSQAFLSKSGAVSGFVNVPADEDDIIRTLPVSVDIEHPHSFPDVTVRSVTGIMPPKPSFGERIAWLRNLDQKTSVFPGKPASALMLKPEAFKLEDKVVLIGADLPSTDKHKTPFAGEGRVKRGESGSRILAQMIAQKLDGRRVTMLPSYLEFTLYLIAAMTGLLIAANPKSLAGKAKIFSILGTAALITDLLFFKFFSILIPTAMVLFTLGLAAGLPALYVKFRSWGDWLATKRGGRT